jgi:polysaccharide deacetylase family protein (PEP-CTERM system associated)
MEGADRRRTRHFFTVDVEEYFQVNAFEGVVSRESWHTYPSRLDYALHILLEALAAARVTGTFFTLGWVAKQNPAAVRVIAGAGHEIASHGFWHRRVTTLSTAAFREDVRNAKDALEDVTGTAVCGYRAPSFSIVRGREWAFDILLEEGYTYDSSLFPIHRPGYGYPGIPRHPHVIRRMSGDLMEFPLAVATVLGVAIPAAGGGYLRQLPLTLIRRAFRQSDARGAPATFYIHPWELDPEQPRIAAGALSRIRHYRGLSKTLPRVRRLLSEFDFSSIASFFAPRPNDAVPDVSRGNAL